jgi:single-strand DNA-binding protein
MASVNRVILIGNLTRDPQLNYLPNNTAVCEFGIATNKKFKGRDGTVKEDVCFVDCTCFGKSGEAINQYMQKGGSIYIEGRLKLDQWEDKNSGGKRSKLKVVVEEFQFIGSKRDNGGDSQDDTHRSGGRTENKVANPVDQDAGFSEEDLPF